MTQMTFIETLHANKIKVLQHFPDKAEAEALIDDLFHFLFIKTNDEKQEVALEAKLAHLKNNFASLFAESSADCGDARTQAAVFFEKLPQVYNRLMTDARAILHSDPAARHLSEVVVAYPGFYATVVYRVAHELWQQGLRIIPRLFSEFAHSKTGIDIHPAARIGSHFAIDHGTGVVIGETSVIGNHVKIYQGVTLGALAVLKEEASMKRHPTIEDDVVIYSGATILGGNTTVGQGSIIGGNVWLTYSVPSNSVVYQKSEVKIRDKEPFPEPLNFVI